MKRFIATANFEDLRLRPSADAKESHVNDGGYSFAGRPPSLYAITIVASAERMQLESLSVRAGRVAGEQILPRSGTATKAPGDAFRATATASLLLASGLKHLRTHCITGNPPAHPCIAPACAGTAIISE